MEANFPSIVAFADAGRDPRRFGVLHREQNCRGAVGADTDQFAVTGEAGAR